MPELKMPLPHGAKTAKEAEDLIVTRARMKEDLAAAPRDSLFKALLAKAERIGPNTLPPVHNMGMPAPLLRGFKAAPLDMDAILARILPFK